MTFPVTERKSTLAWQALALCFLLVIIYFRTFSAGYIWDDEAHLTENPCIVGPLGFADIWTSTRAVYYPLVLTNFWVVHKMAGLNPLPYHCLNVFFHLLASLLLWRVLRQLRVSGAWLGATLWAVHPVLVQSVAWITEMKNTQSAVFFLLALSFYLQARVRSDRFNLCDGLSLVAFAAALTSKPSTVILPCLLLLYHWWNEGGWSWQSLRRAVPYLFFSLSASLWTIWEQKFHSGASGAEWQFSLLARLLLSAKSVWFYLGKVVWPHPLIFIYPKWQIQTSSLVSYLPLLGLLAAALLLFFLPSRWRRPLTFAGSYFLLALLPVLAFFDVYFFRYSFVSDHFQYLASMGPLALAGAGLAWLIRRHPSVGYSLSLAVLLALTILSYRQIPKYHDVFTLYPAILADNPDCWMADYNLGVALKDTGHPEEAINYYREAIGHKSDYVDAYYNLGRVLLQEGKFDEALAQYRKALAWAPKDPELHNNYGSALREAGLIDQAEQQYREAISLTPKFADARVNLATLLLTSRRDQEAKAELESARSVLPEAAEIRAALANILLKEGDVTAARAEFEAALSRAPDDIPALNGLAWLLSTAADARQRDGSRALALARHAKDLSGGQRPAVLHSLAAAYAETGQFELATSTAKEGIALGDKSQNKMFSQALRDELPLYEIGLPYRQKSGR